MPALVAFNRKWSVGSDDFVLPFTLTVVVRLFWLLAGAIVYGKHRHYRECPDGEILQIYYIGLLLWLAVGIIQESHLGWTSAKGSIGNVVPRKHFPKLLYLKFFFYTLEIVWNILGTFWVYDKFERHFKKEDCEASVLQMVRGTVLTGWIMLVLILVGGYLFLRPKKPRQTISKRGTSAQQRWKGRCQKLCCCVSKDANAQAAYTEIAALLASFFSGVDDIVVSDIAAGLILLRLEQQREGVCQDINPECQSVPPSVISEAAYFLPYASSAYGWPFFILFGNPFCGLCQICRYFRICRGDYRKHHDNCCECNMAVIRKVTGLHIRDIVYMNYHNSIYQIPFFVAVDDERKSVVLSIRGSTSSEDYLTDAVAQPELITEMEDKGFYAHKGILESARYIKRKLEEDHVLEDAFQDRPDYKLVIVGHSLGAGAAPLLSVLLHPKWPSVKCYAFEPPGGLINAAGVEFTNPFVVSCVLGEDMVPRMSIETLEMLKDQLIDIIARSNTPKYQILASCSCACWGSPGKLSTYMPQTEQDATPTKIDMENNSTNDKTEKKSNVQQDIPLYLPGKIIRILEDDTKESDCCRKGEPVYKAKWANYQDFNQILLGPRMVMDHIPNELQEALDQLVEQIPTTIQ